MKLAPLLISILVLSSALAEDSPKVGRLSFGWATESIIPPKPVAIGGQYHTRISGEVHDPLTATALAVETRDGQGSIDQAVWVSCDLVGVRAKSVKRVRELVSAAHPELDAGKIIVSATHTHTAPCITDAEETDLHPYDFAGSWAYRIPAERTDVMRPSEYLEFLAKKIADVVGRAWRSRRPGEFSHALGQASVARNRRAVFFDGKTRMYGDAKDPGFSHPEGASDDSLDAMFFWREGKIAGLALTLYCPSQVSESESYLSADFWHETRQLLRERYSPDLPVLALCGAAGDQSPHVQVGKAAVTNMLDRRGLSYRQEIARRIANAARDVEDLARQAARAEVRFSHRVATIPLPVWKVSDERFHASVSFYESGKDTLPFAGKDKLNQLTSSDYINWRISRTMMGRHELQKTDPVYRAEVHALRFDDLALVTNPFELYVDYGLRMKARSPAIQTSVVQLTADSPAYLPTERAVAGGGYSARIDDGVVGPEGGRALVEESVKLLVELWPAGP